MESALRHPADPTSAAFFDVDNTVMQGASIFHLARGLHRRDFFTTREILGAAWKQAYFRVVGVEDPEHVAEARASALAFIAGHTVTELEELGEEIFDEAMAHRIWPGTRALAQLHLDQGQRVWLVTAAPIEIASIIARRLGLTGAMGTVAEHVDGVYTGRLVGDLLHGPAKGEAIKALAAREGLDLARCSAYSDSFNDLPMLRLVGDPCAINPDARLRAHARGAGLAGPRLPHRPQGGPGRAARRRRRGRGHRRRRRRASGPRQRADARPSRRRRGRAARPAAIPAGLCRRARAHGPTQWFTTARSSGYSRPRRERPGGSRACTGRARPRARARRPAAPPSRELLRAADPAPAGAPVAATPAAPGPPAAAAEAGGPAGDGAARTGSATPTWPPPRRRPRPTAPG